MEVRTAKREARIELFDKTDNSVRLSIDGRTIDVDMTMTDSGLCSVLCGGKSYNMEVVRSDNGKSYKISRGFSVYDVEIVDAQARYQQARRGGESRQDSDLCAPMPGKIVRIEAAAGDALKAGDTVVVFEAMKMQSNLKVAEDCTVEEIRVAEGDLVAGGQLLARLDILKKKEE